jgi:hypothetical protein
MKPPAPATAKTIRKTIIHVDIDDELLTFPSVIVAEVVVVEVTGAVLSPQSL